jgi:tetratricopeptide (TPR) repeat protein
MPPSKKENEKEIIMSAETAYLIFQTCLKNAKLREERLWPESLARKLFDRFPDQKPTPDLVFLREKLNDIKAVKDGDIPYPTVAFRTHYFDLLLKYSGLNFQELEARFAKQEPPANYQSLVFKNNIPPIFKEYQPLENLLSRLQMSLCNGLVPVTGIHGMPGMGKSFLAFHYASTNYLRYPGGCWLIPAGGRLNVRESLRQLAETKWGLIYSEEEKKDEALAWRKTKRYLEDPYQYNAKHLTLLIFDNVENVPESFSDLLIDENRIDHVHILLTTRTPIPESRNIYWLAASGLSRAESRSLLARFRPIETTDEPIVEAIFDCIGGFALALAMIGSLLDKNFNIGYQDILSDLQSGEIRFLDHSGAQMRDLPGHYEQKVLTLLLRPLLAGLNEESLSALDHMAQLPPDNVPLPWVEHLMKIEFTDRFPTPFYRSELSAWQLLVEQLKKLSLINATSSNQIVRMHRLLQEVILNIPERAASLITVTERLKPYIQQVTKGLKANPYAKELKWQVPVLAAICEKDRTPGVANARFSHDLGVIEKQLGEFKRAETFFLRAVSFAGEEVETSELCLFYANLSGAKSARGAYSEARQWIESAIDIATGRLSGQHPVFVGLYADLGEIEKELTHYQTAKEWLERALQLRQRQGGHEDGELANIYAKLGLVERDLENYEKAKELLQRAVAIAAKVYPADDTKLSHIYSYMAIIEQNLFNYPEARHWLLRALEIMEAALEPEHPDLASAYSNIAALELETGNLAAAKEMLTNAMKIEEKRYDPGHPVRGNSYFMMGSIEQAARNFDLAKACMMKTLAIDEQVYPPGHYRLLKDYSSLGVVEMHLKNYVDAKIWLNKVILLIHKTPSIPLANLATSLSNIGMIELEAGNLDEARKWLLKAVAANNEKYQAGHPAHSLTYSNLGIVCFRRNELDDAREWMIKAVAIGESFPEKELLKLGNYYFTLGLIENAAGDFEQAKQWFLKVLMQSKMVPESNIMETIFTMTQIGMIEQHLGNLSAAREWMLRSIHLEEELKGEQKDEELAISYTNIGFIDMYEGKYLQAKRWFRKAIDINEKLHDPFHFRLGMNYLYLGLAEIDTDDMKAGCQLLHKAYPIIVNTLGKDHQASQQCLAALRKNCPGK